LLVEALSLAETAYKRRLMQGAQQSDWAADEEENRKRRWAMLASW
jgi:hypothetical protein